MTYINTYRFIVCACMHFIRTLPSYYLIYNYSLFNSNNNEKLWNSKYSYRQHDFQLWIYWVDVNETKTIVIIIFLIEFWNDKKANDSVCKTIRSDSINLCDNLLWILIISNKSKQDATPNRKQIMFTIDFWSFSIFE